MKIEFLHNLRTCTHIHAQLLSKGAWEQVNKYLVLIGWGRAGRMVSVPGKPTFGH